MQGTSLGLERVCAGGRCGSRGTFLSLQEARFLSGVHVQGTYSGVEGACAGGRWGSRASLHHINKPVSSEEFTCKEHI
eukprot:12508858-Ditylum_brightwellii.AAC.1